MILKKIKIIMVEDNMADAVLIERQIKKIVTYPEILHIKDLQELKNSAEEFEPDIVFSDHNLIGFTGFDVLSHIMSLPRNIPFVFITGTINDEEIAAKTILHGAIGYVLKKNINSLHERLLPHFQQIIDSQEEKTISIEERKVLEEIQLYLNHVKRENKIMKEVYLDIERVLKKIKSLKK